MKEFLLYLHTQLSKILLLHKSSEKPSKEDDELLGYIAGTVILLQNYAERSKDGKLYGIAEDMEYSIYHMRVWFKAEEALKDVEKNIGNYYYNARLAVKNRVT